MFFCPERDHICQIGKGREALLHGVYGSTVKNLTLTFGPKIFHMFSDAQKILGEKPNVKLTLTCVNSVSPKVCKDHISWSLSQLYRPFLNDQKESNFHKDIPPLPHLNVLWRRGLFWMCVFLYHRLFLSCSHCCEISSYICVLALYWTGFKFCFSPLPSMTYDMLG